jgi:hypothetical protein
MLVIGLEPSDVDTHAKKHNFKLLSPIEIPHSLIVKCAQAIENGAENLDTYKKLFLTATGRFEILLMDDWHFRAVDLRNEIVNAGDDLQRTVQQQMFEIMDFRIQREKATNGPVTNQSIELAYKQHTLGNKREKVSDFFLTATWSVYKNILVHEDTRAIILRIEDLHGPRFYAICLL